MSTQLIRRKPINYQAKDEWLFVKGFNYRFEEPSYEKFSNGFWDCFKTKAIATKLQKASAFFRTMLGRKSIIEIDSFIWATNANSENYFHWFNDVLPSIYYLKTIGVAVPVLLNEKLVSKPFVKPSLKLLQVEYKTVLASNIIKFKAAFKLTLTAGEGNQHPYYFPQISELFRSHQKFSFDVSDKVFIVRSNLKNRNLYPIDEVSALFIKFGFLIVDTEKMTFAEQMTMFSRCTHLAAVHGAGLTNMLFMPKNSKILEFRRSDDDHNNCYFSMADTLRLNYYYFLTESMIKGVCVQEDNFKADLTSLENLLHTFSK